MITTSPNNVALRSRNTTTSENSKALNPQFSDLKNPETYKNHIQELVKKGEPTPHGEVLGQLIKQVEPLDFQALAFPKVEDGEPEPKITLKHYLVISVENMLKLAEKNRWGLCKRYDFIYLYNGTYWKELDKDNFQKFLGEAVEKMGVPKFSARYFQFREQLFKQFLATAYLPINEINKSSVQINLLNGTFEITLKGTSLKPFDRNDFLTYQLPFKYDPDAKAPIFEKYLNKVLPDVERQRVLAEFLGYVFIRNGSKNLKEEKALILYGTGANGKSVFFEIVNALLGAENFSSYSLQSLTNDNGYFRAKLANKLVNYATEINGNLEASIFKALASGEPVEARLPYGEPFTLTQYAKLIFNCNSLPQSVEHTEGFFRRFLIIPFDVTIPESEQDKDLHNKIIGNELAGVFNWVLAGLQRLLTQKHFSQCDAAMRALERYRIESNNVLSFLNDCEYKKSPERWITIKDLYPKYRAFCGEGNGQPFKKSNFIKQLRALGYTVENVTDNQLAVYVEHA
ncbi:MAG: DNA primase [Chitinophagaceae bacterium]|nr:MAG: DNA primase [Chitinophagaceae bacterium]